MVLKTANSLEKTLWIIGFVIISVGDWFLQQYGLGGVPFKIGAAAINFIVFIIGLLRFIMVFEQGINNGTTDVNVVPPAPVNPAQPTAPVAPVTPLQTKK